MTKRRTHIPSGTRSNILKEYHHGCALCRQNNPTPELHHIDNDPTNHDPLNILPLCPNCHRSSLDPEILSLFRTYKKREILSIEFKILYSKAAAILKLSFDDYYDYCFDLDEDLTAFVRTLKKGRYYAQKLSKFIRDVPVQELTREQWETFDHERREKIIRIIVELLPLQHWQPKFNSK